MGIKDKYKLITIDENFPIINKTKFFIDNNLIKGELKSLENDSLLYLFRLNYPKKNEEFSTTEINLIFYNGIMKIFFFIIRFFLFIIIYSKNRSALNIIIFIIYIIFILLNFLLSSGLQKLNKILNSESYLSPPESVCILLDLFIISYNLFNIIKNTKENKEGKEEDKKRY